ncbi:hypothetical protein B1748_30430 [Paenibacillus sp. MY03]|nr:hypothetical protein B1748_30430 [Paenibacillus sp. MY03]
MMQLQPNLTDMRNAAWSFNEANWRFKDANKVDYEVRRFFVCETGNVAAINHPDYTIHGRLDAQAVLIRRTSLYT